jgi:hypothetical protein
MVMVEVEESHGICMDNTNKVSVATIKIAVPHFHLITINSNNKACHHLGIIHLHDTVSITIIPDIHRNLNSSRLTRTTSLS